MMDECVIKKVGKWPTYPVYKPSGIDWLGEVPEHWKVKRLKWSTTGCINGVWGDDPEGSEDDIICVRVADFDRNHKRVRIDEPTMRAVPKKDRRRRLLQFGDLLLEKSGGGEKQPVGFAVLYDHESDAVCSNFVARVPPADGYDSKFLTFLHTALYSGGINTRSIKQTTGIQNLSSVWYFNEQVTFPPLPEQRTIAAFLDERTAKIDALIEAKRELLARLKEKRQALITHAVTKGLDPNAKMKPSAIDWLGEVPEHWEVKRLKWSTTGCINGVWGSDPEGDGDDIICVRVADFDRTHHRVLLDDPTMRSVPIKDRRRRLLQSGDLLLEKSGGGEKQPVGFVALYDHDSEAVCSNFVARVPPAAGYHSGFLTYLHAGLYSGAINTRSIKQTTGIQNLSSVWYFNEQVTFPPLSEQHTIAAFLDVKTAKIDEIANEAEAAIDRLTEYRTALISAAVTGKIDVRGGVA